MILHVSPIIHVGLWQIMTPPGHGTVGRIYKEDHYTLLHINYESSGPCGFKEDFIQVFPFVSLRELSVAMETTTLIQSASKPHVVNPPTQ